MPKDQVQDPTAMRLEELEAKLASLEVREALHVRHLTDRLDALEHQRTTVGGAIYDEIMRAVVAAAEAERAERVRRR